MERSFVQLELKGPTALVTIRRPERLNALDKEVLGELSSVFEELAGTPGLRAVVLTGEGKAFVAGADIAAMAELSEEQATAFAREGQRVFAQIEALPVPVIAAVNGFALGGGCELALACDFIYASEKAVLGQPEVKLGVIPGFGGTQRLARRVGLAMARELVYTGRNIRAEEAKRIGLVNRVLGPDELVAEAEACAATIAETGPLAIAAAKEVLLRGVDRPLSEANDMEAVAFGKLFGSEDQSEGMAAFLAKRAPAFQGK